MTITFNNQYAKDLGLSQTDAILLIMLNEGAEIEEELLQYLTKKSLVFAGHPSKVIMDRLMYTYSDGITAQADSMFRELVEAYPEFDGSRPLRNHSNKIRGRYLRLIGYSPERHRDVLQALEREKKMRIARRAKGEFVESWKSFAKYIETEGWNLYPDTIPEEKMEVRIGYGEQEL